MSLILNLPAELEHELSKEAASLGVPLSEYALRLIAAGRGMGSTIHTGAELLNYWQGERLIGTRSEIKDSQAHARALRQQSERKARP